MSDFGPCLNETRVIGLARLERERQLPMRGQVLVPLGGKLEGLDIIARASPPRIHRALSLSRLMGIREGEVPRHLQKQQGDTIETRDVIIKKRVNLGMDQLVYRAPSGGRIAGQQGNWIILELDVRNVDVEALYPGTVSRIIPERGAVIRTQGALVQGVWGSGNDACGVLKLAVTSRTDVLQPNALGSDARGAILVAGAGLSEETLQKAEGVHALGIVSGSLPARLAPVVRKMGLPLLLTEGFGDTPMAAPIFDLLSSLAGKEASLNGTLPGRGVAGRPELFIPLPDNGANDGGQALLAPLTVKPGARVRVLRGPEMGQVGVLPEELTTKWAVDEVGARLPGVELELADDRGKVMVPWVNLELVD